jgi:type IV secretory pathway protease TraF
MERFRKRANRSLPVAPHWQTRCHPACRGPVAEPLATFLADRRYLPRGIPLLKRVLALPGQTVCRDQLAITVDKIEMGAARAHDSRGHPLPIWQGCHVIADDEVFLMNWRSADSLDGRYFGVLPTSAIIGTAEPLWIGEEK